MNILTLGEMACLSQLYTQPHRKYHNINHINDCLAELENIPTHGTYELFDNHTLVGVDYATIETAIWYHDAIYNPYSKHNEHRSAALVPDKKIGNDFYDNVREAILATAKHLETQIDIQLTTKIMLDIDLSGFGKPWKICQMHAENIRAEYYNTPDEEFYVGRLNFLEAINKRPTLYYTKYFHNKYHEQSKKNLAREIEDTKWYNERIKSSW
jgi:predicted metal-dependent HD superfamily phosphohydrolase